MIKTVKTKSVLFILPLILLLFTVSFAQNQTAKISTENEIIENIKIVPCKNDERLDAVKKLFVQMGATDADVSIEKFRDLQNFVVTKKGKSGETIIVGAHYDKVKDGCGAIDNWTGIVIIANLYRSLRDLPTDKTYLFVAFDKEEPGLFGSQAMAKAIPKEKREGFCSMVNLDSFGFATPQVMDNTSNSKMIDLASNLAKELNMPFSHASITDADADSTSFKNKDIPAITFHGLSNDWQKFLHTPNDKLENINFKSVYLGYQFTLRYLAKVDSTECGAFRK